MAHYQVNKGIGKSVEFQGLTLRYLAMLAGGVMAIFMLFVVMSLVGLSNSTNLFIATFLAVILVWRVLHLNKRYGEHGAMKRQARGYHPRYIINRVKIQKLFTYASDTKGDDPAT